MKAALLLLALLPAGLHGQPAEPAPEAVKVILADRRISESSGLARSQKHPGVFWTHNDSGSDPCVFAVDTAGVTRAKVRVRKAANFDWEDIAQGTDADGAPCLFIGDIGDNLRLRSSLQVYEIPEPDLPAQADRETESAEPRIWHLTYPDGRHNAETLFWHPDTRRLHLLTKSEDGESGLYRTPASAANGRPMVLEKIATLHFASRARTGHRPSFSRQTTGGDISADGRRLVIATYNEFHEWDLLPGRPLSESLQQPGRLIEPPLTTQMEAVCYDPDNRSLWFTSERLPAPLYQLKRP